MLTSCEKCGSNIHAKLRAVFIGDPKKREIDLKKSQVVCQDCNEEITGISDFMKNTMKVNGDLIKEVVSIPEGGLQTDCKSCEQKFSAKVNRKDLKVYCDHCKAEADISPLALAQLKENGVYADPTEVNYIDGVKEREDIQKKKDEKESRQDRQKREASQVTQGDSEPQKEKRGKGRPKKVVAE